MLKFIPSFKSDVDQIREWTLADPWHQNQKQPEWWLTGSEGFFSCCVQDDIGPVVYLKVEEEAEQFRLHCQFGPRSEVSRKRLLMAMNEGLPVILMYLLNRGKNIVFNSSNPSLVRFMWSVGFKPVMPFKPGEYAICVDQVDKKKF
jgi:hypothetical protein